MLFSKVGVYRTEHDSESFIVELAQQAEDVVQPIHTSKPMAMDEVIHLLRHMELNEAEIEQRLRFAIRPNASAATAR